MTNRSNSRIEYLDAVRAFALLLGIVFHASLSFVPIFIGWAVMDVSTSSNVQRFMLVSHSFRMELFFLIAGFFSHLTFHRKGATTFLISRITRIAIPFLVGWFILRPLMVSGWIMGAASLRGSVNVVEGLRVGFQSLESLPAGIFTGSHLWFLYYLILITFVVLAVRSILSISQGAHAWLSATGDRLATRLSESRWGIFALSVPTAACLWFMSAWGMDTPDKSLVPHWPTFLIYGSFFSLGWLLHRNGNLITRFGSLSKFKFAIAIVSIALTIYLERYQFQPSHSQYDLIHSAFVLSYALMMWSLVGITLGVFKWLLDRPNRWVRYIADASYWLYLIHLPIVVWLQVAFAELPFHWTFKLTAISVLTVGISLLLYDLFVRSTIIGQILNGRKRERVIFKLPNSVGEGSHANQTV